MLYKRNQHTDPYMTKLKPSINYITLYNIYYELYLKKVIQFQILQILQILSFKLVYLYKKYQM